MKRSLLAVIFSLAFLFPVFGKGVPVSLRNDSLLPGNAICSDIVTANETCFETTVVLLESPEVSYDNNLLSSPYNPYRFKATELIVPGVFLGVGIFGHVSHWWHHNVDEGVRNDLQRDGHHKLSFDNFTQLLPAVAGYGMNLFGFRGRHDIADATILYATTYVLVAATLLPLKYAIHSPRPNLKNDRSFPSGHTAIAFAGAELLRREYWKISPWIGVGGYAVAALTGFMRLYNNAHWLSDVLAGAGLGILCAEAAYWLYPVITKAFFKKRFKTNGFLSPTLSTHNIGLAACFQF